MSDVKVTELRQNLPAYLARVQKGERLRVTSRGKVIAELSPPAPSKAESEKAWKRLRGTVLRFDRPTDPIFDPEEWDVNR